ncbi:Hypothetical protein ACI5QL_00830 [Bacillus velezensis]
MISALFKFVLQPFYQTVFKERQWFNKGEWCCSFINLKNNLILY